MKKVNHFFYKILRSDLFRADGKPIDLPQALINLCNAIEGCQDVDWYLGEGEETDLASLIIGAYWSLSEWHGGQSSNTYQALCALGGVFHPGMACGPEEDSVEKNIYHTFNNYFRTQSKLKQ